MWEQSKLRFTEKNQGTKARSHDNRTKNVDRKTKTMEETANTVHGNLSQKKISTERSVYQSQRRTERRMEVYSLCDKNILSESCQTSAVSPSCDGCNYNGKLIPPPQMSDTSSALDSADASSHLALEPANILPVPETPDLTTACVKLCWSTV